MAEYRNFKKAYGNYSPERLAKVDEKELRKEYQRLYRVVQKRLRRFEEAGRTDAFAYRYNVDRILPSTQTAGKDLPFALRDMYRMLVSDRGSVSDLKRWEKTQVEHLHEVGITWVNTKNFRDFGKFMEAGRESSMAKAYGSERVKELFGAIAEKRMDPEQFKKDFDYWMQHLNELKALPKHRDPERRTADAYREELETGGKKRKRKNRRKK